MKKLFGQTFYKSLTTWRWRVSALVLTIDEEPCFAAAFNLIDARHDN